MKINVGVVQQAPVFFNKEASLERVAEIVRQQAATGCELLLFPESFIPGYPRGFNFGAVIGSRDQDGRELYRQYHEQSFDPKGEELQRVAKLAREHQMYIVLGVTEKEAGSLYCSMLYFSPSDGYLGKHRKLKPTGTERVIWGEGQADTLITLDTRIGKLGGLICWENYMPLARMALYQQGVEIYLAPTADAREGWISTLRHIALEGRCFVLGANQYFTPEMYPDTLQEHLADPQRCESPGGSVIISPMGELLEGPLWNASGVLRATLDLDDIPRARMDLDICGHYARPDQFVFEVPKQPQPLKEKSHGSDQPEG